MFQNERAKAAMHFGTINEPNAVATLVQVINPLIFPDYRYVEEGLKNFVNISHNITKNKI